MEVCDIRSSLPPVSLLKWCCLECLHWVCTQLFGLQDLSAEHDHFMHVFLEDSEQKGLFLDSCSWCWCYCVL